MLLVEVAVVMMVVVDLVDLVSVVLERIVELNLITLIMQLQTCLLYTSDAADD